MPLSMALYNEFRAAWPLDRVRKMTIEEYTQAKKNTGGNIDTFTYWLEAKLENYGSIWGGSAFKFGIYSRNDEESKKSKAGRMYAADYAWYSKYGKSADEAFRNVRSIVVSVIEAVQRGDLAAIDKIDLGDVYKWKIAFHYQRDIEKPLVLDIYDPAKLRSIAGLGKNEPLSACHKKLLLDIDQPSVTDYAEKLWNNYHKKMVPEIVDTVENRMENLNTIFYGPPGTGKTYNVLQFLKQLDETAEAVAQAVALTYLDVRATYWHLAPGEGGYLWDTLKNGSRLGYEWCSNEYGDLKGDINNNDHQAIIKRFAKVRKGDYFVVISGFRLLGIARALHDYDHKKAITKEYDFQTVEVEWITKFDIPVLLNSTQTMTFCNIKGGTRWDSLVKGLAERGFIVGKKEEGDSPSQAERRAVKSHLLITFHQSYSYEDFIQGIKPVMNDEAEEGETSTVQYCIEPGIFLRACEYACQNAGYAGLKEVLEDSRSERKRRFANAKPFYLVIDEINRGNIANIFGELISLIETDKRLGNENETIVSLPYSKQSFGVPANLYLIGTMNTADRSVEALDSALRRRFSFIETYPRSEVIEQPEHFEIDLKSLLDAMNARLMQVLDRDHTIGHAYFTGINNADDPLEALAEVFRRKVLPQLQEYFYASQEKLRQILGPAFVTKTPNTHALFEANETEPSEIWTVRVPATGTDAEREDAERAFRGLYKR